jgi:3-oxoacyl-[acyl-carrier-protein] synthase II
MSRTRVVVTGMGTTSPLGGDVASTWEGMLEGRSGVRALTDEWAAEMPVKIAGRVAVEPTEVLERVKARRLDRSSQFAMVAAMEAWRDSGLEDQEVDSERLGVAMASGIGGVNTLLDNYDVLKEKGPRRVSPLAVPMLMPNAPAAQISLYVGARAAVNTPVSACASGNEAIALAVDQIRLGRADVILAGGTEAAIHPLPMAAFANMMALSKNAGDPATVSRPWDTGRDGFVLGEGAGVLVLESGSTPGRAAPGSTRRCWAPASPPTPTTSPSPTPPAAAGPGPSCGRSRSPRSTRVRSSTSTPTPRRPRRVTSPRG